MDGEGILGIQLLNGHAAQNAKTHQAQPIILGLGVFWLAVELFFFVLLLGCLSTS